ncbi:uncharacterized protein LOC113239405 isoform X2 [Hyposmocoma kahamanoa]|uniref:uncharacterized protein LOC113239405 isoform X2 n=1 Tax=Hyposmocoma kahamanoa TaxID=1477025 RepID=UPI000E6D6482|nr:uncharacterized protein LOC113239405 isoform X2 [Hyposmocoma kahamanoa]
MLEVCVDSLESAINAIQNGADELELCSSLPEGGLTPSPGLVRTVIAAIDDYVNLCNEPLKRPKLNIMIRCRGGSDFYYSDREIITMFEDIEFYKTMNVDRFVFGGLTPDKNVDVRLCAKVITRAAPKPVTFHRAFDCCRDPREAMKIIIGLGFDRVLTSGHRPTAAHLLAIQLLKQLLCEFGDNIQIMPGAGITVDNVKTFIDNGFKIVHSSCKVPKKWPKNQLSLGTSDSNIIFVTDGEIVRKMKQHISASSIRNNVTIVSVHLKPICCKAFWRGCYEKRF